MEGPTQNGIQSTQEQQATVSVMNSGINLQQPIVSQQPVQFQNIAGPGQIYFNGNLPPPYYGGNPYPQQGYLQDPTKMTYATYPMQPYPTSTLPQMYGGNYLSMPQQQPVMVIQQQPTSVPNSIAVQTSPGDNYFTLSAVMTCLVLIAGGWPSLLCTISAILISFNAKSDEKRGNIAAARAKANISLGLNVAAVVFVVVMWSVVAIPVAVTASAQASAGQLSPSTMRPTTSTVRPTTSTTARTTSTTAPTPYCYTTSSSPGYYCYTYYCYRNSYYTYSYTYNSYQIYYFYSCSYGTDYSSYSYYYNGYYYTYSRSCSLTYLACSYG